MKSQVLIRDRRSCVVVIVAVAIGVAIAVVAAVAVLAGGAVVAAVAAHAAAIVEGGIEGGIEVFLLLGVVVAGAQYFCVMDSLRNVFCYTLFYFEMLQFGDALYCLFDK